jgi:hypothetical protein
MDWRKREAQKIAANPFFTMGYVHCDCAPVIYTLIDDRATSDGDYGTCDPT